jgi:hypothetical protein
VPLCARTSSASLHYHPIGTADLSDAGVLNEVDYLLRAALRLVLDEEVANAAEQHELGAMLQ